MDANDDENGSEFASVGDTATTLNIINEPVDVMKARWAKWSLQDLDAEILNYRTLLQSTSEQLQSLGVEADGKEEALTEEQDALLAQLDPREWEVPPHCIPIHANVTTYDWAQLYSHVQFDVIMMDPPWQLATANPTRGVALGYSQLTDKHIQQLPIPQLQAAGFLLIWVINAKYKFTLDLFKRWGYKVVDEIVWVKLTVNRRLAKSHGYYLQHAKEVCLVGAKGAGVAFNTHSLTRKDVIVSERRGQSQKPEEIYEMVEDLVPNGKYLEIFGRKNNLHNFWVTVGNEVTGTGLPPDDAVAVKESRRIPGAVYGRAGGA